MNGSPNFATEISTDLQEKRPRPDIAEYVEPRDELERAVCQLWSDVLMIDRIGRDDSILDLGGDSFHMVLIAARLTELHGLEIEIQDFFEYGSVANIVGLIRAAGVGVAGEIDPP